MSNHANNLGKLTDGLAALKDLVETSVHTDMTEGMIADIAKETTAHAEKVVKQKTAILEKHLERTIDEKIVLLDNKYKSLVATVKNWPEQMSAQKVPMIAEAAKQTKSYADDVISKQGKILENNIASIVDEKIQIVDNRYATLVQRVERLGKPDIQDRSLSGNKIHGGMITNFASRGILDESTQQMLRITDSAVEADKIKIGVVKGNTKIEGNLETSGTIVADKIQANEIQADVRVQRTKPLVFESPDGNASNKGLIWAGDGASKQFIYTKNSDRFFSSESIDIHKDKTYRIADTPVLSATALGTGVIDSKLRTVGVLKNLQTTGNLNIDSFVFYDSASSRLGIGTDNPSANVSIQSFDHEFIISSEDNEQNWQVGSRSTVGMQLVTDNTPRITITKTGSIQVHSTATFNKVSIDSTNNDPSVKFSVGGPIVQDGKKFIVSTAAPTNGSFSQGDIAWNATPQSKGYVGWICVRAGAPGDWKPFGLIG